ncbi:related to MOT2 - transcriptional repressor [Cephalotrichum gorgonifer]|uniref:Related to MOT2 - transcriptional repressor n=1 Tax=Cephalotrichum gorgonifer TaxID=2041049 RepID=A0AAE8SXK8_9PEZI|nr:related to MOT2 - transcriptional repressor [Cephalotrichum gorgonifer]
MAPQDTFIEDDDDVCPLCIEEFDLSDRNFRPCPCGYQVCQFCFNNIKSNMNGLCPACRRPYDESTIQWKVVTPEEEAEFRANITKNQKKRAVEQRQKEAQKREAEKENRKNLVGVRVVQKNLVYVTGLTPTVREDELTKTLRKPEFFGQYGNIQKISISNRKGGEGQNPSLGIYVTFEKPEEADRCIRAVNGSQNGERVLRAQLGTTKYCSAWLKHEQCTNRGCMFLHERGEEEDSYTRQDLSSMNSIHTQRPVSAASSSRSAPRQQQHPPPAAAHAAQAAHLQSSQPPPSPATQPSARPASKDGSEDNAADGSALPVSANWARNPQQSRRGSHATSGAAPSPAISASMLATTEEEAVFDSPVAEPAKPAKSKEAKSSKAPEASSQAPKPSTPKGIPEDVLKNIVKKLYAWKLPELTSEINQSVELYPPLFDIRGGEKRRAMREEEEARLAGQQEETVLEALEPSEGEPEAGGSHALGGEPEEREPAVFDPRRGLGQPPIQRSSADGIFGPALSQTSANQGSITSRTMTPQQQQQMFMRPQSAFTDHLPPGISTSGSLSALIQQQQQQGHSRQTSRFSFANENSSGAASVQLAANPRIMAQQKAMMPASFPSQQGSQFYTTSVPGPPPGLKSTGTPPSMFGQGPSFGGSPFGAAPKDSNADLLQSIIRGRAAGSAQGHEAAKREYLNSPFSNQYPTSSTPAPAPGLLASLYDNQPGAFQDFGSKQKKKGKKHRHANTSSSGGSGLVDLADPSILQARMQHQSQSNAGVGQGPFGGQSQDDDLPSLDDATTSVDALVADDEPRLSRQPTPSTHQPPFQPFGPPSLHQGVPPAPGLPVAGFAGTPSGPPPGLGFAPGTPRGMSPLYPVHSIPSRASTPAAAGGSLRAHTPSQAPRTATPIGSRQEGTKKSTPPGIEVKQSARILAGDSSLPKDVSSHATPGKAQRVLQDEDFPALSAPKPGTASKPAVESAPTPVRTPKPITATPRKPQPERAATPSKPEAEKRADKRPAAPVLNIAAAIKTAQAKQIDVTPVDKMTSDTMASASSSAAATPITASAMAARPGTPASTSTSTTPRGIHKTLRLVPTPKTEVAPSLSQVSHSLAGITAARIARPGTPTSEVISDSASIVSASIATSRASSPPPSSKIVGSAAIRTTTKSQQRKQRKEVSKVITESLVEPAKEEEHAPVEGRKKKQKKEKKEKKKREPSPGPSAKDAPGTSSASKKDTPSASAKNVSEKAEAEPEANASPVKKGKEGKNKGKGKGKVREVPPTPSPPTPEPPAAPVRPEPEKPFEKPEPTPESILRELIRDGLDPEQTALLKPIANYLSRTADAYQANKTTKLRHMKDLGILLQKPLTSHEEDMLRAGTPIRRVEGGQRVLVTRYGDVLRNLSEEEEERYLVLQERVAKHASDPAAFKSDRHRGPAGDFSIVEGRMVVNGPPAFFPQGEDDLPESYSAKIRREETLDFMSQFYVPGMRLGNRTLLGEEWLEEVEDKATVEIMHGLKAMFHSQRHREKGDGTKVVGSDSLPRFLGNEGRAPIRPLSLGFEELERGVGNARKEAERGGGEKREWEVGGAE